MYIYIYWYVKCSYLYYQYLYQFVELCILVENTAIYFILSYT